MSSVLHNVATFKSLEVGLLREIAALFTDLLSEVLSALDDEIRFEGLGPGWQSVGKHERELDSLFGLRVRYARRGYRRVRPDGKKEYRWPLDELLGLPPGERFCPLVQYIAVTLATKMSFRETAEFMQTCLQVAVSHEQIHRWVQAAGEAREAEERAAVEAVLEGGEVPSGEGPGAELVVLETDGLFVRLQREQSKVAELKLGVMHQGWEAESPAGKRYRLAKKEAWGGVLSGEEFWERGMLRVYRRCDPEKVGRVVVNGDGAEWVKLAPRYLPRAEVYLDRFHRNRALREGLGFAPELLERAHAALRAGEKEALKGILAEALALAPDAEHVARVKRLQRYLEANWDGLEDWRQGDKPVPEGARGLGAAEPQIEHILAARMTKRGMSWRLRGAHHMTLLRCLEAEGTLAAWLDQWQGRTWPRVPVDRQVRVRDQVLQGLGEVDPAAWLRGRIPMLATAAGATELGRRLKALTRLPSLWDVRWTGQPMPFRGPRHGRKAS